MVGKKTNQPNKVGTGIISQLPLLHDMYSFGIQNLIKYFYDFMAVFIEGETMQVNYRVHKGPPCINFQERMLLQYSITALMKP